MNVLGTKNIESDSKHADGEIGKQNISLSENL